MAHKGTELTAEQVWHDLMAGNMRFVQGLFMGRNLLDLRQSLARRQAPKAAVLCCSDSRVPAEIIFDQSLGDLFVVRTAGLVLEPASIGSLEYAVDHLHVPLLVIKGHECCGAVTAAVNSPEGEEGNIGAIISQIAPAAAQARETGAQGRDLVEAATDRHLTNLVEILKQASPIIAEALKTRRLALAVTKYFLQNGQVETLAATDF